MSTPGSTAGSAADAPTADIPAGDASDTAPVPAGGSGSSGSSASSAASGDDEVAERGRLDISFTVVRRIAEHAADSSEITARMRKRIMGVAREAGATARVSGYGEHVDLRLEVPLVYPTPIAPAVDQVRGAVRERVQTLTGYTVRSLDVTVSALAAPAAPSAPTSRTE